MKETEEVESGLQNEDEKRLRRFLSAAGRLASKKARSTSKELEEYSKAAQDLPDAKLNSFYEVEKARNTERFREVVKETRRLLGIKQD